VSIEFWRILVDGAVLYLHFDRRCVTIWILETLVARASYKAESFGTGSTIANSTSTLQRILENGSARIWKPRDRRILQ